MQALILTAGSGTRMQGASEGVHKALLSVGGTTILGRLIDELTGVGVDELVVAVGGSGEGQIVDFLRDNYPNLAVQYVRKNQPDSDNIADVAAAFAQMESGGYDDDVILAECDVLLGEGVVAMLLAHPCNNIAAVDRFRTGLHGTVVRIANGKVAEFISKDDQGHNFDYSNTYKTVNLYRFSGQFVADVLAPVVRRQAEARPKSHYEEAFSEIGSDSHGIAPLILSDYRWAEVDDPNDLRSARFAFEPGRRSEIIQTTRGGNWNFDFLDFAMIRNAYFPTGTMVAMMRQSLEDVMESYGSDIAVVNKKLSYNLHCRDGRLQTLHGATQAYPWLRNMWAGKTVAYPWPTFGEYPRMFSDGLRYEDQPGKGWGSLEAVADTCDVVVIVNPNNPTGSIVASESIYELATQHPSTTFLVDDSFHAFSGQTPLMALLEDDPLNNVVILSSLSKVLGAPGLRLGYLYSCNHDFIRAIGRELPIWNLSASAEFMLELWLKFDKDFRRSLARTMDDRENLAQALAATSVVSEVYPSGADFLLVRLVGQNASLAAALRRVLLEEHNIDTKDVTERFEDGMPRMRLAVRNESDNRRLVRTIERACAHPDIFGLLSPAVTGGLYT